MPPELSVQDCLGDLGKKFASAASPTPALDARLLVQAVTGLDHAGLILKSEQLLTTTETLQLAKMVQRRLNREPVSRILGEREFYGRDFLVTPDVLDPRPDTETLVDLALSIAKPGMPDNGSCDILDIGTGTGAIIITLLCELPVARGHATDISAPALKIAGQNARRHQVDARLVLQETGWCSNIDRKFDMIVSNPPYIAGNDIENLAPDVRNFDPVLALDGGKDGLQAYHAIAEQSPDRLKSGGIILLETGFDQAGSVVEIFQATGFKEHQNLATIHQDLAGKDRLVTMLWDK